MLDPAGREQASIAVNFTVIFEGAWHDHTAGKYGRHVVRVLYYPNTRYTSCDIVTFVHVGCTHRRYREHTGMLYQVCMHMIPGVCGMLTLMVYALHALIIDMNGICMLFFALS